MTIRVIALGILISVWCLSGDVYAAGNESRCDALGSNCICSEPLNTNSYSTISTFWKNPADTTTKECAVEGVAGGAMEVSSGFGAAASSGAAITALPAAHTNTWVYQTPNGGGTSNFFGSTVPDGSLTARRSIRFYFYYSSDYTITGDGTGATNCNSGKMAQFGRNVWEGPLWVNEGVWSFYDINASLGWNQTVDPCCSDGVGPGNYQTGPNDADTKGRWWRVEIITHNSNTTGPGTYFEMFIKDVTNNGPELHVIDTSQTRTSPSAWTSTNATTLHPTGNLNFYAVNMFRGDLGTPPNDCVGQASYSHLLIAGWDTDADQRIGAATEIEGSGGSTYSGSLSGGFLMQGVVRIQ